MIGKKIPILSVKINRNPSDPLVLARLYESTGRVNAVTTAFGVGVGIAQNVKVFG